MYQGIFCRYIIQGFISLPDAMSCDKCIIHDDFQLLNYFRNQLEGLEVVEVQGFFQDIPIHHQIGHPDPDTQLNIKPSYQHQWESLVSQHQPMYSQHQPMLNPGQISLGKVLHVLFDFSLTVKAAPHKCVIRTGRT